MMKLTVFHMDEFEDMVNGCRGEIRMVQKGLGGVNIKGQPARWQELRTQHKENGNSLRIALDIRDPRDYMRVVTWYAGNV